VARKQSKPTLEQELRTLNESVPESVRLPSLADRPPRVQGYAYRFFVVLPLLDAEGHTVFSDELLGWIYQCFDDRFGGCLVASSRSGAPFFGEYLPEERRQPVRDYHTVIIVYANPVEASDRFFLELKSIPRRAPLIEQEEILIERSETYLN
jgi:hypothetical protein